MQTKTSLLLALMTAAIGQAAHAQPAAARLDLLPFANPIVGHWQGEVTIGPCAGGPTTHFLTNGVFNAGGTLGYTSTAMPPAAVSPTFGSWTWGYDRASHRVTYKARMQFHRYTSTGVFDGLQDIHRALVLSSDGDYMTETVVADVVNADGSLRVRLCGTGTDRRIATG